MKAYAFVVGFVFWLMTIAPLTYSQVIQASDAQTGASYSDTELRSFAVAALEVKRIRDAFIPQLESAASAAEQQQVQQAAVQEMSRAVEKEGMSVQKYNEIADQVRSDPTVAQRVREHLQSTPK